MKTAGLVLALLILCASHAALAGGPREAYNFLYSAALNGPLQKGTLYRVTLHEEILRNCTGDCADIRILDQHRNEIPYAIIQSREDSSGGENYTFEIIGYDENPGTETVTMRLPEKHRAIGAIKISTRDRDFRKKLLVHGSRDMKTWNLVSDDSIWDFSSQIDLRKTEITFPESNYRYYRLVFRNVADKDLKGEAIQLKYRGQMNYHDLNFSVRNGKTGRFHIDRVEGSTPQSRFKPVYDGLVYTRFLSRKDRDCTIIDIQAAVPFERVSFDIGNPYYFRKVGLYFSENGKKGTYGLIATGQVYSFPLSEMIETRKLIECPVSGRGYYRFVIENRNNPPLEIRSIKFQWVRRNLYFIALSDLSRYTMWIGDPSLKKPDYDIAHFINQCNWHTHSAQETQLGKIELTSNYKPAAPAGQRERIEKTVLISIAVLLVGVIGSWLYTFVKNANFKDPGGDR